jgi:putative drug exporter of the RND superfamily
MAMFLTPAVTALLGSRAWWPGHQDRGRHGRHGRHAGGSHDDGQTAGDDLLGGLDAASGARA